MATSQVKLLIGGANNNSQTAAWIILSLLVICGAVAGVVLYIYYSKKKNISQTVEEEEQSCSSGQTYNSTFSECGPASCSGEQTVLLNEETGTLECGTPCGSDNPCFGDDLCYTTENLCGEQNCFNATGEPTFCPTTTTLCGFTSSGQLTAQVKAYNADAQPNTTTGCYVQASFTDTTPSITPTCSSNQTLVGNTCCKTSRVITDSNNNPICCPPNLTAPYTAIDGICHSTADVCGSVVMQPGDTCINGEVCQPARIYTENGISKCCHYSELDEDGNCYNVCDYPPKSTWLQGGGSCLTDSDCVWNASGIANGMTSSGDYLFCNAGSCSLGCGGASDYSAGTNNVRCLSNTYSSDSQEPYSVCASLDVDSQCTYTAPNYHRPDDATNNAAVFDQRYMCAVYSGEETTTENFKYLQWKEVSPGNPGYITISQGLNTGKNCTVQDCINHIGVNPTSASFSLDETSASTSTGTGNASYNINEENVNLNTEGTCSITSTCDNLYVLGDNINGTTGVVGPWGEVVHGISGLASGTIINMTSSGSYTEPSITLDGGTQTFSKNASCGSNIGTGETENYSGCQFTSSGKFNDQGFIISETGITALKSGDQINQLCTVAAVDDQSAIYPNGQTCTNVQNITNGTTTWTGVYSCPNPAIEFATCCTINNQGFRHGKKLTNNTCLFPRSNVYHTLNPNTNQVQYPPIPEYLNQLATGSELSSNAYWPCDWTVDSKPFLTAVAGSPSANDYQMYVGSEGTHGGKSCKDAYTKHTNDCSGNDNCDLGYLSLYYLFNSPITNQKTGDPAFTVFNTGNTQISFGGQIQGAVAIVLLSLSTSQSEGNICYPPPATAGSQNVSDKMFVGFGSDGTTADLNLTLVDYKSPLNFYYRYYDTTAINFVNSSSQAQNISAFKGTMCYGSTADNVSVGSPNTNMGNQTDFFGIPAKSPPTTDLNDNSPDPCGTDGMWNDSPSNYSISIPGTNAGRYAHSSKTGMPFWKEEDDRPGEIQIVAWSGPDGNLYWVLQSGIAIYRQAVNRCEISTIDVNSSSTGLLWRTPVYARWTNGSQVITWTDDIQAASRFDIVTCIGTSMFQQNLSKATTVVSDDDYINGDSPPSEFMVSSCTVSDMVRNAAGLHAGYSTTTAIPANSITPENIYKIISSSGYNELSTRLSTGFGYGGVC